jgi:hypothetical protein
MRGAFSTIMFLALGLAEPLAGDTDLPRYAITQGGLLACVLIVLWAYRKDALGALQAERDKNAILVGLVGDTRAAMVKHADAFAAQASSIERLARIVDRIDERREGR